MRFIAEVMLGRLARLMRFAGYDVEYDSKASDERLLRRSRYRILLTKDRELAKLGRKGRFYFVESIGGENQLGEIKRKFPPENRPSRCMECNHGLRKIRKERIRHLVPPFVFGKYDEFYCCAGCRRIYWKGTHFKRMSNQDEG
jgi:uncharacterized protein with PIN domain